MPFVPIDLPSIQLGLLKAVANRAGLAVTNYHLALDFARQIGPRRYSLLANQRGRQVGEWLFSSAAFRHRAPDRNDRFLKDFQAEIAEQQRDLGDCPANLLRVLREREVPTYLNRMLNGVPWSRFRVVGFTSTFQQNVASLAIAALIKQHLPGVTTVFGGANLDGEMGREIVRAFDCVDYAISGD